MNSHDPQNDRRKESQSQTRARSAPASQTGRLREPWKDLTVARERLSRLCGPSPVACSAFSRTGRTPAAHLKAAAMLGAHREASIAAVRGADRVTMRLAAQDNGIIPRVIDNGCGGRNAAEASDGLGPRGLSRRRAARRQKNAATRRFVPDRQQPEPQGDIRW